MLNLEDLSDETSAKIIKDIKILFTNCFKDTYIDKAEVNYYIDLKNSICKRENNSELDSYLKELMFEWSRLLEDDDKIYSAYMELSEIKRLGK